MGGLRLGVVQSCMRAEITRPCTHGARNFPYPPTFAPPTHVRLQRKMTGYSALPLLLLFLFMSRASSAWTVDVAATAPAVEKFAASELRSVLAALCPQQQHRRQRQPPATPPATVFHVGFSAAQAALGGPSKGRLLRGLGDEGFLMGSVGTPPAPAFVLAGGDGSARGTLYAAYELMHRLGVRFFAWDETFLPPCPVGLGSAGGPLPVLPLAQHHPALEYRFLTTAPSSPTLEPHYMWLLRNRFNVVMDEDWHAPPNGTWWTPEHGLGWRNAVGFPEATSYTIFGSQPHNGSGPPLKYYNSNREWFWPNNNSGHDGQLCWSNASLVAFLTSRVQQIMAEQPNTTLLSLSVLDNHNYCKTAAELAVIAEENGSPAGPLIRALNAIGAAVEAEWPGLTLDTLAYLAFTPAPKTAPRRNVAVRVCSVSCDFGRTLSDPTNDCDGFKHDVDSWVALANRSNSSGGGGKVWTWNYEADDEDFLMPWPDCES